MFIESLYLFLNIFISSSLQICQEEVSSKGISVTWKRSAPGYNIQSDPPCYRNGRLITRDCENSQWFPPLSDMEPCFQVIKHYDLSSCPPGFYKISEKNNDYCYQINRPSIWNNPCFRSGGASVITDLNDEDIVLLLQSLNFKNVSRYFWLPARRSKTFHPVIWYIPGRKWGWPVEANNTLRLQTSILKNCLLLDIEEGIIITEACTNIHPSLCFYINDVYYPAKCPPKYRAFRFMPDDGVCFGIEQSKTSLTYNDFLKNCSKPMGYDENNDLRRFIFKKIAEISQISNHTWCWFSSLEPKEKLSTTLINNTNITNSEDRSLQLSVLINNAGTLNLINASNTLTLPCMACEVNVIHGETELMFEYSTEEKIMYLTVYFPSGLWKYNYYDKGIQCFSDAKGFVKVIDIDDLPINEVKMKQNIQDIESDPIDKIIYIINLITDRTAQYWCEGHTKEFSLITTEKIVVNPQGNEVHVFSLVIKMFISKDDVQKIHDVTSDLSLNITNIFNADKALLMDILEYNMEDLVILMHLHVTIDDIFDNDSDNIVATFNSLKYTAKIELPKYSYSFVNISSAIYCLPTKSFDDFKVLNWELTAIGHTAAPKEFCLQANGLPVRRICQGSYLLGSSWGNIEGTCNKNYMPSTTTTFLYNFVKGHVPENDTSRFLIDGLGFVLSDVDIIIPADIYYLSIALKHSLYIFQNNDTTVDMGDIENIAWVMDRVLDLDSSYLRLAQTLNSTNMILDSVSDIIEILSEKNINGSGSSEEYGDISLQLAIQPQFIIQISHPKENNVTGIAIAKSNKSDKFTDMTIHPLYTNTTFEDVISIKNLEIATWLPEPTLKSLRRINVNDTNNFSKNENIRIIINVFYNDVVFQELNENHHKSNSRIIGVSVPGFISNLKYPVHLIFKNFKEVQTNKFCGYWDFQVQKSGKVPGFWSNRGCYKKKTLNNLTICECYHLTHFGQLINIGNPNDQYEKCTKYHHNKALNIITLFGCFLSLVGIVGIWITASVFHAWRKKAGTKVLLHLSAAIACPLIFILIFNLDNTIFYESNGQYVIADNMRIACISLGAMLHYSVLASFMWMFITAILQFIRYVRVLGVCRPSRFMVKFTIIGWGIPLLPVITILVIDKDNYLPVTVNNTDAYPICYPSGFYLIMTVIVPVAIILIINITLFILVVCSISRGPDGKMRIADADLVGSQIRLSIFLFFLLGLTWVFGIFSFSKNVIWSYLFCLTSTLQGFVLFVYFILCDPNTRNLWITLMKPQFRIHSSRDSITSISSG